LHRKDEHTAAKPLRPAVRSPEVRRKIAAGEFTIADLDGHDFATAAETAAVLRADARTIRARCEEGKIPGVNVGEWRIPVQWLREQTQAGAAA
jgi:hypothetical protein